MSSIWGTNLKLSIFGESHGSAIGGTIDGLPGGLCIDFDQVNLDMNRRSPGKKDISTPRKETDAYEILSGIYNGKTTGTPLVFVIKNKDTKSSDYETVSVTPRPGHADYTGYVKYGGFNDPRGGGHFSGRLTAPLVFAGSIAKQILALYQIHIAAHIHSIGDILDVSFSDCPPTKELQAALLEKEICTISDEAGAQMREASIAAQKEGDSIGGIIETCILGLPSGIGSPIFDSFESKLSAMVFSVPGVKGVSFGEGFAFSKMKGSASNDAYRISNDRQIITSTNHNGGILGGITNGMDVLFQAVIKPTPSIAKEQLTVDMHQMKETTIQVKGRHDPCIAFRAVPVLESCAALVALDFIMHQGKVVL